MTLPNLLANGVGNWPDADKWNQNAHWLDAEMQGNFLVNPGFEDWDISTSHTNPANATELLGDWTLEKGGTSAATANFTREGTTIDSGTYAMKAEITIAGSSDSYLRVKQSAWRPAKYQGLTVVLGVAVRVATSSKVRLSIYDGVGTTYSSYHTGGGSFEVLTAKRTIDSAATELTVKVEITSDFLDSIYVDSSFLYIVNSNIDTTAQAALAYREKHDLKAVYVDTSGNVGIGTTNPSAKFEVDGSVIINESGAAVDFRVEGDTKTNLLFVDGSADRVGIGASTPDCQFHVFAADATQTANGDSVACLENSGNAALQILSGATSIGSVLFGDSGSTTAGYIQYDHNSDIINLGVTGSTRATLTDVGGGTFSASVFTGNGEKRWGWSNLVVSRASVTAVDIDADYLDVEEYALTSVNLTATITTSGANGLDTGSEASSTFYSVWVIYNPATQTAAALLSASHTSPTMPSGYTKKRLVGFAHNNGSSDIEEFRVIGDEYFHDGTPGTTFSAAPTTGSFQTVTNPATVVPNMECIVFMCAEWQTSGSGGARVVLRRNGSSVGFAAATGLSIAGQASDLGAGIQRMQQNSSRQIQYYADSNTTSLTIRCLGFVVPKY